MCLLAKFVLVKKHLDHSDATDEDYNHKGRLYKFLKAFLAISLLALVIEIVAYSKNWIGVWFFLTVFYNGLIWAGCP